MARHWARAHPRRPRISRRLSSAGGDGWSALCPIGFRQIDDGKIRRAANLDVEGRPRDRRRAVAGRAVVLEASDVSTESGMHRLLRLGLLGAPLVGPPEGEPRVPGTLGALLAGRTVEDLCDARRRELQSVMVRRAARREAERRGLLVPWKPRITVVMATNRPDDLDHAIAALARQSVAPTEVLFGFHGPNWTDDHEARARGAFQCDTEVVRYDDSKNLGEVLQGLSEMAAGEVLTKWDDDDWYGADHLEDLVDALRYSGADLVGKAAEFVRLESTDLTVRRFAVGAETSSRTLAGGTLMFRRSTLDSAGGWAPVPRHVDKALIDAVRAVGGRVYRTHGFGYLLRRRAGQHTWSADDGYFLQYADEVRAGLDLSFAGCDA